MADGTLWIAFSQPLLRAHHCGYYLDELTMDNGPIVVVPGSHLAPFRPPACSLTMPDEKFVLAKPGQAVMFDGWTCHRGAGNRSSQRRRVCLMCSRTPG